MEKQIDLTETYSKIAGLAGGITGIRRESDNAFIPIDEGNSDYQNYLEWLKANEPKT